VFVAVFDDQFAVADIYGTFSMIDIIKQSGVQDIRTLRNLRQLALKNWPLFIERPGKS
jgi:hypothetical protein